MQWCAGRLPAHPPNCASSSHHDPLTCLVVHKPRSPVEPIFSLCGLRLSVWALDELLGPMFSHWSALCWVSAPTRCAIFCTDQMSEHLGISVIEQLPRISVVAVLVKPSMVHNSDAPPKTRER